MGTIDVLNVSQGHLRLTFDPANPIETAQAELAVQEMLRRGYMLFVEIDGGLQRVTDFDAQTGDYIIGNIPGTAQAPPVAETAGEITGDPVEQGGTPVDAIPAPPKRGRPRGNGKRVPAQSTKATAIARTSGG